MRPWVDAIVRRLTAGRCLGRGQADLSCLWLVTVLLFLGFSLLPPFQAQSWADETPPVGQEPLKSVYLYNFLQFVTWPIDHLPGGQPPVKVIGVLGDAGIRQALAEVSATLAHKNQGNTMQVRWYGDYVEGMALGDCHILFVGASERHNFPAILASLKQRPVLTVSDVASFLRAGGMITLQPDQNRLRYHINIKEATAAGLRLSSQLLKTAIEVREQ